MNTRKVTLGSRPYKVRAGHNLDYWKIVAEELKYDTETATIAADEAKLNERGVKRDFVQYAIRNDYLKVVH